MTKDSGALALVIYLLVGGAAAYLLIRSEGQKFGLLVVAIVGVLFTLAYLMGEDRYAKARRAAHDKQHAGTAVSEEYVEALNSEQTRQWLDDFLVKQQRTK